MFSDRYSQDLANTFIAEMRPVERYARRYQFSCGLVAKLRLKYMEVPLNLAFIRCCLEHCRSGCSVFKER